MPARGFIHVRAACTIRENEQTAWGDRALVRAMVRNRAGSVAILLDTLYFAK